MNAGWACVVLGFAAFLPLNGQPPDFSFFESKIRPVLVAKCYGCHSAKLKAPMGGLALDTKTGLLQGGTDGKVIVPGKPRESKLLKAITYSDANLQMPPTGKLPDSVIQDFSDWIAAGAPDSRVDPAAKSSTPAPLKGMSIADGRKWWAFQPVHEMPPPPVREPRFAQNKIDSFILARLDEKKLAPSPEADRATLMKRAYIDLVGYRPSYQEIQAFVTDTAPDAYEKLVDTLLASPH